MAVLKFGFMRAAIVDFLRTSAALITETGHTTADPRIVGASKFDDLPDTGCFVFTRPARQLFMEVDAGPFNTSVHLYLKHTNEISVYTMLGIIQELVAESSSVDASYTTHASVNLNSIRWSADHSNAPEVQKDAQGYWWTDAFLLVRWREV